MRPEAELEAELNRIEDEETSKWPGMTYEQGVGNTLRWALGWVEDHPMED